MFILNPYRYGNAVGEVLWDETDKAAFWSVSESGVRASCNTGSNGGIRGDRYVSTGKRYFEVEFISGSITAGSAFQTQMGVVTSSFDKAAFYLHDKAWAWTNLRTGEQYHDSVGVNPSNDDATWGSGTPIISCAIDFTDGKIWWARNNVWAGNGGAGNPATGANACFTNVTGALTPAFMAYATVTQLDFRLKSLTADFTYSPPSGYTGFGD